MDKSYIVIGMQDNTIDYTGYTLSKNNIYGFESEQLSNQYVIVYSILVHEQEEVVLDLVKNIFYFNKRIPCCIILHCSVDLYSKIADKFKGIKHLYINPKPVNKKWCTYSLFESHLDNYSYISHVCKVSFKYFILLSSNCLFHKEFTIDILNEEIDTVYDDYRISEPLSYTGIKNIQFSPVKVKVLLENNNFCNVFKYNGIKIVVSQVEGAIIDKETMEYVPMTSDQALFEISTIKEEVSTTMTTAIKESSIDCSLYSRAGAKEQLHCLSFGNPSPDKFSYEPDYKKDTPDSSAAINKEKIKWEGDEITIRGKKYISRAMPEKGVGVKYIYDLDSFKRAQENPGVEPVLLKILSKNEKGENVLKNV